MTKPEGPGEKPKETPDPEGVAHTVESTPVVEQDREPLAVAFFFVLFVVSLTSLMIVFSSFVTDIVLALLFAALSAPLYKRLLPKVKNRPWLASALVCMLIVVLVAIPVTFLVVSLSTEAAAAYSMTRESMSMERVEDLLFGTGVLADWVKRGTELLGVADPRTSLKAGVSTVAGSVAAILYERVNAIVANVFAAVYHFVIMLLAVFYLLIDGPRLKRFVFRLSPLPDEEEELIGTKFKDVGKAIVFGNGIASVLQGVLGGFAMAVVGLPSPVLWGTVITLFAFLPLVGISVVALPASAYLFLEGRYFAGICFLAFCMIVGLFMENVVKTKLIGDSIRMHNLIIFLSILGGLGFFGIIGILYGPLLVALFLTFVELYEQRYKLRLRDPMGSSGR